MASWLVIPKASIDARLNFAAAQVVEAAAADLAADTFYRNCVVLGPVNVYQSDATHHERPATHLPADGQPQ
jgi:hypothetical protein